MSGREDDRRLLQDAVRAAGMLALVYFRGELRHWEKAKGDPVSEADHAVNDLLRETLAGARPAYGWLSEESQDAPARLDAGRVWVVDPIDGTRAFIDGKPEFTVAVALVEDGRPVLAIVFNPATDEFFEAAAGEGARLNGAPIRVTGHPGLGGARLISGKRMFERAGWADPPEGASFFSINSLAYRISLVAAGRYDAVVSLGVKSEWDVAAADLVLSEAGGRITTARGEPYAYNKSEPEVRAVVAAGPALHDELLRFLATVPRPPGARW